MSPKLIVGLGNPGKEYKFTFHNIGFMVLDHLAEKHSSEFRKKTGTNSHIATISFRGNERVVLAKPLTYVNLSGIAVEQIMLKYGIKPQELLVVVDDFALPLGKLRLRLKGSSGGHNGLESIIGVLKTEEFPRLRVGIGPLPSGMDPKDFVLSKCPLPGVTKIVKDTASAIEEIIKNRQ
ncbi:MAG: aminoacyl-tRNA hydrolase [Elusimicrobiota bacterium]